MLTVDVIDRVIPYAADGTSPIVFVDARADEHFAIDARGSLVRVPSRPTAIARGRKLAMKPIRATAAAGGDDLLEGNCWVPTGGAWVEPTATPLETVVCFN